MNELQVFNHEEFGSVRTTTVNNEVYFVGKDVATILGYSNPRKAIIDHVDEEDKGVTKCDTLGGTQDLTVINESGLYSLILSSKLLAAKKFKRWVTNDVLPSTHKHGLYAVDEILNNPDMLINALTALKEERAKSKELMKTIATQEQQISEMQPKVNYYDMVLNSKDLVAISVIAKDYGWSATRLNQYLSDKGVQYKCNRAWLLYQKYASKNYTHTKTISYLVDDNLTRTAVHTYWTQAGRLFIYDLLKADGILPIVERNQ